MDSLKVVLFRCSLQLLAAALLDLTCMTNGQLSVDPEDKVSPIRELMASVFSCVCQQADGDDRRHTRAARLQGSRAARLEAARVAQELFRASDFLCASRIFASLQLRVTCPFLFDRSNF